MVELIGVVIKKNQIDATYRVTVLGETSVKTKADFDESVVSQGAALVQLCDDLTPEIGDVIGVQLYTSITDPDNGGATVDLLMKDNGMHRVSAPPQNIADARDALKMEIEAAL